MSAVLRAVLVAALIAWAGCTAKPPAEVEAEPDGSGTVAGVTVNPNVEPVAGARVELRPGGDEAQTDLFGRFRFEGVAPGTYQIAAQADGHEAATVTVPIVAGETSRPRIVLSVVQAPEARHETMEYQGYFPATFGPVDDEAGPLKAVTGDCTCRFPVPTPPDTVAVVVEAVWNDNLVRPDQPTRLRWEAHLENETVEGNGTSPLNGVVTGDMGDGFFLYLRPDDAWPAYDQSFQVFVTVWEVEAPPEGWSRVKGDG